MNAYIHSKFYYLSNTCLVPLLFVVLFLFPNDYGIVYMGLKQIWMLGSIVYEQTMFLKQLQATSL